MAHLKLSIRMSKIFQSPAYESLSESNLNYLTEMTILMWPECDFYEEKHIWKQLMGDGNNYIELTKIKDSYVGFIHLSIRHEYVEGSEFEITAYLEAIYIKPEYRKNGIANQLLIRAEKWAKSKGLKQIASDTEITNWISQIFHQRAGFLEANRIVCYVKNI